MRGVPSEAGLTLPDLVAQLMARLRIPEAYASPSECIRAGHPLGSAPAQSHHFSHNVQRLCGAFWGILDGRSHWRRQPTRPRTRTWSVEGGPLRPARRFVVESLGREVVNPSSHPKGSRWRENDWGKFDCRRAAPCRLYLESTLSLWDAHHAPWGPQPGLEEKLAAGQCRVGATTAIPSGWATHPDPCPAA